MITGKKIRIATVSFIGTVLLLSIILVTHIALARQPDNATTQLSRIDFDKPFDSLGSIELKNKLLSIPGVKREVFVKGNVVIYFHDNRITNSKKVFDALMTKGNYTAHPFIVPASIASKPICPIMNHDGTYYKFTQTVHQIFN